MPDSDKMPNHMYWFADAVFPYALVRLNLFFRTTILRQIGSHISPGDYNP